jgi:hypothetical protein
MFGLSELLVLVANRDCRKIKGRTVGQISGGDDPVLEVGLDISNECWYGQAGQNGEDDQPVKLSLQIRLQINPFVWFAFKINIISRAFL